MKLPHAAALALVVWYLLAPPPSATDPEKVNPAAPLLDWELLGTFGSSDECAREQKRLLGMKDNDFTRYATCVAPNDPGLEGKKPLHSGRSGLIPANPS